MVDEWRGERGQKPDSISSKFMPDNWMLISKSNDYLLIVKRSSLLEVLSVGSEYRNVLYTMAAFRSDF